METPKCPKRIASPPVSLAPSANGCGFRTFSAPYQLNHLPTTRYWANMATMSIRERAPVALDDVSKAIIEQLQQDGRRPYATIGKAVGLSEAAVRQRVQRLQDGGVMAIVAITDPVQLGFTSAAMIGVRVDGDIEAVAEKMELMPEVDYLVVCAGSFDILAEVIAEDDDHLLDVVNRHIRAIPGVRSTETFVYLKLRKQIYTWGKR